MINVPATATYAWNFGDGATAYSRNTQHTYLAAGTYTVTLTITDTAGCEGSVSHDITVTPPPAAHFTASLNNCQGQAVAFTNLSTTTAGYLNSWKWDFGDGSPIVTIAFPNTPDVTHTYAVTGIFNVTLTVTNSLGCSHSETITMNVFGAPTSDFYSSGHCLGDAVHFTDISTTPPTSPYLHGHGLLETPPREYSTPLTCRTQPIPMPLPVITQLVLKPIPPTVVMTLLLTSLPFFLFLLPISCLKLPVRVILLSSTLREWHWEPSPPGSGTLGMATPQPCRPPHISILLQELIQSPFR
ncbi:MAG: PKD domain-containing protein [Bacteroidales bacterium]|nr:PKD domain-containing protein [Bacteroidales bacterium]